MRLFLAAPFTGKIDPKTLEVERDFKKFLYSIISHLESDGHEVVNAHLREKWGLELEAPESAIQMDFGSIRDCDILIAYPGNPPSPGVHMELGFAVALGKPIIIIHDYEIQLSYLAKGLHTLTNAREICFNNNNSLLRKLSDEIEKFRI